LEEFGGELGVVAGWAGVIVTVLSIPSDGPASVDYAKRSKTSGKERATNKPSWAGEPLPGEKGSDYAKRELDENYGSANYDKGPGSEYNQLKKYADRKSK
jgi:hypothetical protein